MQHITHTKDRRKPKGKAGRRVTTPGASGYLRTMNQKPPATFLNMSAPTKPVDPESQYRAQVKSLEAAITTAKGSEALRPTLQNHQLKLAQVHREWVTNGLGFRSDLAKLGFFVAGSNDHQRSVEGRRLWEAADALERAARANSKRKPWAP